MSKKEEQADNFKLLQAVGQGDSNAFRLLYAQFHVLVYNTALGYLQNEQDAEEIVQEVFISINNSAIKFKGNAAVHTWIYRITINKCLDALRKRKRSSWLSFFSENNRAQSDLLKPYFAQLTTTQNGASDITLNEIQLLEKQKIEATYQHFEEVKKF